MAGALVALVSCAALADDDDHRLARDALERGLVRPFSEIQETVKAAMPGDILGVELETDDAQLVYDIEVLSREGQLMEVKVDATTGKVLKIEREDEDD